MSQTTEINMTMLEMNKSKKKNKQYKYLVKENF